MIVSNSPIDTASICSTIKGNIKRRRSALLNMRGNVIVESLRVCRDNRLPAQKKVNTLYRESVA
ncbi:MAG: hypothetical protein WDA14_06285 [Sphaerochaetaceae bacterium]